MPTASPGKNFTVVVAVSPVLGLVHYQIQEAALTSDGFQVFMEAAAAKIGNVDCCWIFDNCSSHDIDKLYRLPSLHGIATLPPYSPFLNPIENVFSAVKAEIKRELAARRNEFGDLLAMAAFLKREEKRRGISQADVRREFVGEIVKNALEKIVTPDFVVACENHADQYVKLCKQGQPIND